MEKMVSSELAPSSHRLSAIINKTLISVVQVRPGTPGAPREGMWFLRRTQVTAHEELRKSRSLEPYSWGSRRYVFCYEMGELHLYHSEPWFPFRVPLSSSWKEYLSDGYSSLTTDEKHWRGLPAFFLNIKTFFSAVWQSKNRRLVVFLKRACVL